MAYSNGKGAAGSQYSDRARKTRAFYVDEIDGRKATTLLDKSVL